MISGYHISVANELYFLIRVPSFFYAHPLVSWSSFVLLSLAMSTILFYVKYMYLYDWSICREMDFLSRQHSCFNLHSCASSLGSLSRLVCTGFLVEFKVGSYDLVWKWFLIPFIFYFFYFIVKLWLLYCAGSITAEDDNHWRDWKTGTAIACL